LNIDPKEFKINPRKGHVTGHNKNKMIVAFGSNGDE